MKIIGEFNVISVCFKDIKRKEELYFRMNENMLFQDGEKDF